VRIVGGKLVFNLLPERAPHKGLALRAARARFGCETALYVGDDETDEDVFALDEHGTLLTVRVERSRGSCAAYYLQDQDEIDPFLEALIACGASGRIPIMKGAMRSEGSAEPYPK
jgi:trehalose 6-phosphate phosphatase